ncbi:hypothetical protein [Streptomyces sp. NPDC013455]|uniref:hypothetical protein n=1 Tax=Streptomyces sp. NPDC013455 TaxID=3155605 RepID=UPI0033E38A33
MVATVRPAASRRPDDTPSARIYALRTSGPADHGRHVPFWIHTGPDDRLLCSVSPAAPDTHDVRTADGTPLARITRRSGRLLLWPRRVRWTARLAGPSGQVTGKEGSWYAWLVYVVTAPVWFLYVLCATVYAYFDGSPDDFTFGGPARTRWRTAGAGTVLDYKGLSKTYRHTPGHWDARGAYALAALRSRERQRAKTRTARPAPGTVL